MMSLEPDFFLEGLCLLAYAPTEESKTLLRSVVDIYNEAVTENAALEDPLVRLYVLVITEVLDSNLDLTNDVERTTLMMKFQQNPAVIKNPTILEQISALFHVDPEVAKRRAPFLQRKVRNWVVTTNAMTSVRRMYSLGHKCATTSDMTKQETYLNDIYEEMRKGQQIFETNSVQVADTIDMIDFSNKESLKRALLMNENNICNNAYRMGLQGFGRLFGETGGPMRGEFAAVGASSHNYKSGTLMDVTRWIAQYNKPHVALGKKAAIVFISLENEIYKNLKQWFMAMYVSIYHKQPEGLTLEQIVEYVYQEFNKNGFTLLVFRKDGDFFGYKEFVALHKELEEQGYEICASIIDYLTLMRLDDETERADKRIQKLGQRLKTYANHHNELVFTAIQLNGVADELNDSGQVYVVKKYGASTFSDCKSLLKEFDFFAFQYIEKNDKGVPYLTWAWKKHRYDTSMPAKDKFCAYRFTPLGLLDDIDAPECRAVYDIYSDATGEEEETSEELFCV